MLTNFLGRLRRDKHGNTLAMMAIALIPLSAMAGSAVDMGRLYVVKVRLQQACDAGVLAGRKNMVESGTALDEAAKTQARTFFANNFPSGFMGTAAFDSTTSPYPFTATKTAENQVAGTATATVPMSIMKMFAAPDVRLDLTCEARYDVADTDVMFVLDTTGSMACAPEDSTSDCTAYVNSAAGAAMAYSKPADGTASGNLSIAGYPGSTGYYVPEKTNSRIKALREAVLSFYDTMDGAIDPATKVRYGFVTYTSTVNAGRAIMDKSPSYMLGGTGSANWNYQSRVRNGESTSTTQTNVNNSNSAACALKAYTRSPATGYDNTTSDPGPRATSATAGMSGSTCVVMTTTYLPKWTYSQYAYDVASYVGGMVVPDPTKAVSATARWQGCIEERQTTAGATSFSLTALPNDLNPDLIPSSAVATQWKPMWPEIIYDRNANPDSSNGDDSSNRPNLNSTAKLKGGFVSCGKPVQRLSEMTRDQVSTYVNATDFRALGGTYHDTGMIWGTRMLSPNGIFASDTAAWAGHQAPNRVLIFMTDGDMAPSSTLYGMYGLEERDQRVTAGSYTNSATYKNFHNQRFLAECSKAKALGMDVWVVAVGQAVTTELSTCASSTSQAIYAGTSSDVSSAFANIARHVGALRISR